MTSETWGEDGKLWPAGYQGPPPILETAETGGDDGGGGRLLWSERSDG